MTNTIRVFQLDTIDFELFSFTLLNWMNELLDLFYARLVPSESYFDTIYTYALYHVI